MSEQDFEPYTSQISVQLVALMLAMRDYRNDIKWKRVNRKLSAAIRLFTSFAESKGSRKKIDKAVKKIVIFGNEIESIQRLVSENHLKLAAEIINSKFDESK